MAILDAVLQQFPELSEDQRAAVGYMLMLSGGDRQTEGGRSRLLRFHLTLRVDTLISSADFPDIVWEIARRSVEHKIRDTVSEIPSFVPLRPFARTGRSTTTEKTKCKGTSYGREKPHSIPRGSSKDS